MLVNDFLAQPCASWRNNCGWHLDWESDRLVGHIQVEEEVCRNHQPVEAGHNLRAAAVVAVDHKRRTADRRLQVADRKLQVSEEVGHKHQVAEGLTVGSRLLRVDHKPQIVEGWP